MANFGREILGTIDAALSALKRAIRVDQNDNVDVPDGELREQGQRVAKIATGIYTGDGTTSQAITGIGFQPKYLRIWPRETSDATELEIIETTDTIVDDNADGIAAQIAESGGAIAIQTKTNRISSLDSDGFTVDDQGVDNTPNANGVTYNYMAIG